MVFGQRVLIVLFICLTGWLQEQSMAKHLWKHGAIISLQSRRTWVFGPMYRVHVLVERRHKLEVKTDKGIFLNYSTQSKDYRIYNLKYEKLLLVVMWNLMSLNMEQFAQNQNQNYLSFHHQKYDHHHVVAT